VWAERWKEAWEERAAEFGRGACLFAENVVAALPASNHAARLLLGIEESPLAAIELEAREGGG
tara:strand:- start:714 stop:902 length:189 start_codon:yes stop_codon:yes gene_type:complete